MCISCGWKPDGGNGMFDNPIFQYMQDAFEKAGPQMTGDDKIPDEFSVSVTSPPPAISALCLSIRSSKTAVPTS